MPAKSEPTVSLYLDVDGVVNPFGPLGTTDWGTAWKIADAGILDVVYAAEMVTELNELALHPAARFVWLTTWEWLAPQFLCPAIGLHGERWPVLSSAGWDDSAEWWKLDALRRDVEARGAERIVWVDDQLDHEAAARSWAEFQPGRVLWISPDPRRGLRRRELAAIREFLG
ncbi:HAD domain-containing protein [Arthrobacter cavernae]|uniref:HAD domain-containing protein n=1 Tax=Arthrobacter cavernae TaxID=2817681 RepID=UPI0027DC03B5|nr:HAD domain-containing protein [Arthrobacter cavernae]